jgi:hypothetical protein
MGKQVKPLSPKDLKKNLDKAIPSFVITAVNKLLKKDFRGGEVIIMKKDLMSEIKKIKEISDNELYDNKWLDFEPIFRKNGWNVTFESPDRGESFDDYFKFKPKGK